MDSIRQEQAAAEFAARWQGKGYEKGESQAFWIDLLGSVMGFSANEDSATRRKTIFDGEKKTDCAHINAYLLPDGADVFVGSRSKALCDVPDIGIGNKPIDGGNYLFTEEDCVARLMELYKEMTS